MKVEGVPDLHERQAQRVMPIGGQHQQTVADAGAGEGVFHIGFHGFLTTGAVVAVDDMFRHFRSRLGGQVFDDPEADALFTVTALERSAAVGTTVQAVFFPAVDVIGLAAGVAGMARLAARFFLPAGLLPGLGGGLEMRGNHPGRGGGRGRGRLQMPGDFQEKKDERFLARGQDPLREKTGLLFPEGGAGVEQFGENLRDDRGPVLFHTS